MLAKGGPPAAIDGDAFKKGGGNWTLAKGKPPGALAAIEGDAFMKGGRSPGDCAYQPLGVMPGATPGVCSLDTETVPS